MAETTDLPRSFAQSDSSKAKKLRDHLQENVVAPRGVSSQIYLRMTVTSFSLVIPYIPDLPKPFREKFVSVVVDRHIEQTLLEARVLNWCTGVKQLVPLSTLGDGNCLVHAVSMAVWGIEDSTCFLRRLLYMALVYDEDTKQFQKRWQHERQSQNEQFPGGGLDMSPQDFESEWDTIVKMAEDKQRDPTPNLLPFESLEEIHVFVLANILRRPIVVLSESVLRSISGSTMDLNNIGGVYLPLLWPANNCVKEPVVIGYDSNHFVPMVSMDNSYQSTSEEIETLCAVPLVTHNFVPLTFHFLKDTEARNIATIQEKYMNIRETVVNIRGSIQPVPVAMLNRNKIKEEFDMMKSFYQKFERHFRIGEQEESIRMKSLTSSIDRTALESKDQDALWEVWEKGAANRTQVDSDRVPKESHLLQLNNRPATYRSLSASSADQLSTPLLVDIGGEEAARAESVPELSITNVVCKEPGCCYFASKTVFPYCNSHARKHDVLKQAIVSKSQVKSERNPSRSLEDLINLKGITTFPGQTGDPQETQSLDNRQTQGTNHCMWRGCHCEGLSEYSGLCLEHYTNLNKKNNILTQDRQTSTSELLAWQARNSRSTVVSPLEGTSSLDKSSCVKSGCTAMGNKKFRGYCFNCFTNLDRPVYVESINSSQSESSTPLASERSLLERQNMASWDIVNKLASGQEYNPDAQVLRACKTENCSSVAASTSIYCTKCLVARYKAGKLSAKEEPVENLSMEMSVGAAENIKIKSQKCLTPSCEGVRCPNSRGLCYYCYSDVKAGRKPEPNKTVRFDAEPLMASQDTNVLCLTCELNPVGKSPLASRFQTCEQCAELGPHLRDLTLQSLQYNYRAVNPSTYPEITPTGTRCKNPYCGMHGTEENYGFCSTCVYSYGVAHSNIGRPVEATTSRPTRPASHYGNVGEVLNQWHPPEMEYGRLDTGLPCRNHQCPLFGDPYFNGYCSRCFKDRGTSGRPTMAQPLYQTARVTPSYTNRRERIPVKYASNLPAPRRETNLRSRSTNPVDPMIEDQTKKTFQKIETGSRLAVAACKVSGCPNYGNSKCRGYCNTCFVKVQKS